MSEPGGSTSGGAQPKAKRNTHDDQSKTIKLNVISQDGRTITYRFPCNAKLSNLMRFYCKEKQLDFYTARFFHEGRRVLGKYTPNKLKLEDGAEIHCMLHQMGGGSNFMPKNT
ncbi:hypothetical protein PTKIN_Ptkin17bG0053400 [Pterospermum kingtungense]